jgi:hypothetical protein
MYRRAESATAKQWISNRYHLIKDDATSGIFLPNVTPEKVTATWWCCEGLKEEAAHQHPDRAGSVRLHASPFA